MIKASDIMTRDTISASPETDVTDVLKLMSDHQVSGIPIVDANRHVVGIVTEYDLFQAIISDQLMGEASDFMHTDVVTIPDDTEVCQISELFLRLRIRRVPVTQNGKLIGIVSRRDIVHSENYRQQLPILWPSYAE